MKRLLLFTLLTLSFSASAQTVTNISCRITTTTIVTGVSTNTAQTTVNLDVANAKEKAMIDGAAFMYAAARVNGETATFDSWLSKTHWKDQLKADSDAYNRTQNQAILDKLATLLTTQIDLLSASDLSSLNTIAAKAQ